MIASLSVKGLIPASSWVKPLLIIVGAMAIMLSAATGARSSWIYAKAAVAQHLLDTAWNRSLFTGQPSKPWHWADIATVGRLDVPMSGKSFIVLSDASGEAMAFGPGLVAGKIDQLDTHTIAIGGHRDTHLAFLEHLPVGTHLRLQNTAGHWQNYAITQKEIVNTLTQSLKISEHQPGLVLITCYPFSAGQIGGPLRLVVQAALLIS